MRGEQISQRPEDCPIGLWAHLCETLRAPEKFIEENPDTFEELKIIWARTEADATK